MVGHELRFVAREDPAGVYATSLTSLQPWGFQFRRLLGGSHIPYPSSKQQVRFCIQQWVTDSVNLLNDRGLMMYENCSSYRCY